MARSVLISRLPAVAAQLGQRASDAVEKAGRDIEAGAKARARVDTGYMKGAIDWTPEDPYRGEVVAGADYTIYNEFGTSSMPAQPMLVPATEDARPGFEAAIRGLAG